jgi:hypothetical protein
MNPPKVKEYDYINCLIATHKADSGVEAERVQPEGDNFLLPMMRLHAECIAWSHDQKRCGLKLKSR